MHSGIEEDAVMCACQMSSKLLHLPTVDQSKNITLEKGHYQSDSINFRKNINIERQAQCDSFLILRAQLCHSCSPIFLKPVSLHWYIFNLKMDAIFF